MNNILELVWLSLAILSFLAAVYNWYQAGFSESVIFFIMTFISALMYLYRRNMRISRKN